MKRFRLITAALMFAALAISCQTEEAKYSADDLGGYKFNFTIAAGGFDNTKADATVGWTVGEKVYVFFKPDGGSLLGGSDYAAFTYDGTGWTPSSFIAPGALGQKGTMSAVYVPYLDIAAAPVFNNGTWSIDGGSVYYSCTSRADYEVKEETVYGRLSLKIPDGFVQFVVDEASAKDGDLLSCNYIDAYTCVMLNPDMSFYATPVVDNKMVGHTDNGKTYFWGKLNDCTDAECTWTLTNSTGDVTMGVTSDKIGKNSSFNLTSMPEIAMVQLWENGPCWATVNLGASKPEELGDYYAWGETEPKTSYDWTTYKWCEGTESSLKKYCLEAANGTVDYKTALESADDIAYQKLGGEWRIPTAADFNKLKNETTQTVETIDGVKGIRYTSNSNGNSIFLPLAGRYNGDVKQETGYGYYWTKTLDASAGSSKADVILLTEAASSVMVEDRFYGNTIRPVYGEYVAVTSISLGKSELSLAVGDSEGLGVSLVPANATNRNIRCTTSDASVATVNTSGTVTAVGPGTAVVTVASEGSYATCTVTVDYPYVDLGLSVKWATCNVGAATPEGFGDYFAWGETEPYYGDDPTQVSWKTGKESGYAWSSYSLCNGSATKQTKYCTNSDYGTKDSKTVLEPENDAASVKWGSSWRMPTDDEWAELCSGCTWTAIDDYNNTGVAGYTVTGTNGNSIFLPANGYRSSTNLTINGTNGFYWSSSLKSAQPHRALCATFNPSGPGRYDDYRYMGRAVRPVYGAFVAVSTVSLNKTNLTLDSGSSETLTATVSPSNSTEKAVFWETSDAAVATVSGTGAVTAVAAGTATITAICGGKTATCTLTVESPSVDYPSVDLGLSVVWATYNVGATTPEGYGDYYAWGEIEPKYEDGYAQENPQAHWKTGNSAGYSWTTYTWSGATNSTMNKYCTDLSDGSVVDYMTVLELSDDVARQEWGDKWRMPTDAEWTELRNNCTWTKTDNYNETGVAGYIVTSTNGNSIFLPEAGHRYGSGLNNAGTQGGYWSSSLRTEGASGAWYVHLTSSYVKRDFDGRLNGRSIRPVYGDFVAVSSLSLNKSELALNSGDSETLTATVSPENATEKTVFWKTSDAAVATVSATGAVTAVSDGTATITAYTGGKTATCTVTVGSSSADHPYVDLGLSVVWATYNVGATTPEGYGDYFAWGETEPYYGDDPTQVSWKTGKESGYAWSSYNLCNGTQYTMTKYCTSSSYGPVVDNKTVLDAEDDAASANWGGDWRMPTDAEFRELNTECTWTWTDNYNSTGVAGIVITSNKAGYTDKSIFLPAAGMLSNTSAPSEAGTEGYYYSSSLYSNCSYGAGIKFDKDSGGTSSCYRYRGRSVRPVKGNAVQNN